jgi:signal transduction histidine kinase
LVSSSEPAPPAAELQLLHDLAESVACAPDVGEVFEAALHTLERATGAPRSAILLLDTKGVMRFKAWHGLSDAYRDAVTGHSPWPASERSPEDVLVRDVRADDAWARYLPIFEAEGVRALAFFPVQLRERLLGKFMLYYSDPHDFAESELCVARTIAHQVALAVGRWRAADLARGQSHVLELLSRGAPLALVLETLAEVLEAQSTEGVVASFLVLREGSLSRGAGPSLPIAYAAAIEGSPAGEALSPLGAAAAGRSVGIPDVSRLEQWNEFQQVTLSNGFNACWCYPIVASSGEVLGTLGLFYRSAQRHTPHDIALVDVIAHVASLAIERARADAERRRLFEQIAERDRHKDEFLAILAHELRNPLAPLSTAVELLRQQPDDPELWAHCRRVMERQVGRLSRLVEDLLDISRVNTGKLELRPETCDLMTIVERALESSSQEIESRGHQVCVVAPPARPCVRVDPLRVEQVLTNLLHNAAKYTPPGGRIDVRVELTPTAVAIRVRDNGIGLSGDVAAGVFEPCVPGAAAAARSAGGIGVGLALARRLTRLHGGELSVTSPGAGAGSEFTVHLPPSVVAATPAGAPDAHGASPRESVDSGPRGG